MTHWDIQLQVVRWLLDQSWADLVTPEVDWRGIGRVDVLGLGIVKPRVAVVEVKASIGDLRADLRRRKMLRYEHHATHVYLAGPEEVVAVARDELPKHWGLLEVSRSWQKSNAKWSRRTDWHSVWSERAARQCPGADDPDLFVGPQVRAAARSLSFRAYRESRRRGCLQKAQKESK